MVLAFKILKARIRQQQHPNAIIRLKLNGQIQEASVINYVSIFIVAYVAMLLIGSVGFAASGFTLDGSIAASVASLGNVGLEVCDFGGFANASSFARFFAPILMLFGRLEIFGFIQLFLLNTWK